jgi:gluconokinase
MLGMKAVGEIETLDDAKGMVGVSHRHRPDEADSDAYEGLMEVFVRLYDRLEPEFEALNDLELPSGDAVG